LRLAYIRDYKDLCPIHSEAKEQNMKGYSLWWSLLVVTLVLGVTQHANAGSLSGNVIEVGDGDNITVSNQKRPVRVKLLGVDAPEKTQAFYEVATQHLRDLILNKFVTVQYSGLGQHGVLIGKVLFHDLDIGAQMIRDGVAWFDPNNKGTLSKAECELYRQSEEAARNEKRGLWQAGDAVAPWEFVKRDRTQRLPAVSTNTPIQPATTDNRPQPGLTSKSLLGLQIAGGALSGSQANRAIDMRWATEGR
jgi:endonuclease YncB( thermonuclease family)